MPFSRIGAGYLGGKGRGIAFLHQLLADQELEEFGGLPVSIPQTIVVTTDQFDLFLEKNDLRQEAYESREDERLRERFFKARLGEELLEKLERIVGRIEGPLAVRSSSLLEDSMHQPFAGIYSTLMIPNQNPDPTCRLRELAGAIKLIYASTFSRNAKSYLAATGNRIEEEKMGVIIQRLVGRRYDSRFYPHFSGLAQSCNYYPLGPQKVDDGIVHVALGLGRQVVDGGLALRFSPRHPRVMPQFATAEMLLDSTQRSFWALELNHRAQLEAEDLYSTLKEQPLEAAEMDGTLGLVGSVYNRNDDRIRDNLSLSGPRVVTFNNILQHRAIPLPETLLKLLEMTERGLGCAVELEFACDMGDWGKRRRRGQSRSWPCLYLLQLRPLVSRSALAEVTRASFSREDTLCRSLSSLGHGVSRSVTDLVFVRRDRWDSARNREIASEVGELNARLVEEKRSYVLIGPGRWGTADEWLGIPVQWSQISGSRVIVEASPDGYHVDPSQGTHFFHNMTAQGIGYLTLPPGADKLDSSAEHFLDWEWLEKQVPASETAHLSHLRFEEPMGIILDGPGGRGLISRPGAAIRSI